MLEPTRSRYLRALGIDSYVPRLILPGALPSAACEWETAPEPPALAGTAVVATETVPQRSAPQIDTASSLAEHPAVRSRAPEIDVQPAPHRTEPVAAPVAPPKVDAEAVPRIALGIAVGGGVLLVDDAPASPAERGEFQRLLGNILFALHANGAQPALDIFLWPMSKQPQLDRSAAAARETLAAHIQNQIQRHAVHTVLLLGTAAAQWAEVDTEGLRCVRTVSALGCLREPAQKRQLWQDIRHLAAVH
jgi:hypothetical protein